MAKVAIAVVFSRNRWAVQTSGAAQKEKKKEKIAKEAKKQQHRITAINTTVLNKKNTAKPSSASLHRTASPAISYQKHTTIIAVALSFLAFLCWTAGFQTYKQNTTYNISHLPLFSFHHILSLFYPLQRLFHPLQTPIEHQNIHISQPPKQPRQNNCLLFAISPPS